MQDVPERLAAGVHDAGRHEAAKLAVRDAERLDVSRSEERRRFRPLQVAASGSMATFLDALGGHWRLGFGLAISTLIAADVMLD